MAPSMSIFGQHERGADRAERLLKPWPSCLRTGSSARVRRPSTMPMAPWPWGGSERGVSVAVELVWSPRRTVELDRLAEVLLGRVAEGLRRWRAGRRRLTMTSPACRPAAAAGLSGATSASWTGPSGGDARHADDVDHAEGDDGQQEVHGRAGGEHDGADAARLAGEAARARSGLPRRAS